MDYCLKSAKTTKDGEKPREYVRWERATNMEYYGDGTPVSMTARFRMIMHEDPRMFVEAVLAGQSPADGRFGHYGLKFEGVYLKDSTQDNHHVTMPVEYKGVVIHTRAKNKRGSKMIAEKIAHGLGLPYIGTTR